MKRIAIFLSLVVIVAFSGCVSKEQQKINDENSSRAEENAVDYIKEKYGFKAKVVDTEVDSDGGLFGPDFNGYVFVTMEYDDEEFTVYIDGEEKTTDGKDNYQQKEIEKYIQAEIGDRVNADSYDFLIYNMHESESYDERKYYLFLEEYFDGSNIKDVLSANTVCCIFYPENADLYALDETYISEFFADAECGIYSGNEKDIEDIDIVYGELTDDNYKYEHAMYINEAVTYNHDGYTYYKPEVFNVGDMYYVTEDNMPLEIYEYDADDIMDRWDISYSSDFCTSFYHIPKTDCSVTVFFESDKLPNNGEKCGIIRLTNNSEHGSHCVTDIIGEYNVTTLYSHHLECYCAVENNGIVLGN